MNATPENEQTVSVGRMRRLVRPFRSDRLDARKPAANAARLDTRCTRCQKPTQCHWPPEMTFSGVNCTAEEYMTAALQSENIGIYCGDCLEKMPDVTIENLFEENLGMVGVPLPNA